MSTEALTRRLFMQGSGTLAGSLLVRAGMPAFAALSQAACSAKEAAAVYENLSNTQASEIIAIAARILPITDTPGATEAGAVYFFDKSFTSVFADIKEQFFEQLTEFQAGIPTAFSGAKLFSDLDDADQDTYLKSVEQTPFFGRVRYMTLCGVFGMSMYGGNRDNIGWQLVGMDGPPHAWQHPFGYYDTEYQATQAGGPESGN